MNNPIHLLHRQRRQLKQLIDGHLYVWGINLKNNLKNKEKSIKTFIYLI